jgi:hypothetical protein
MKSSKTNSPIYIGGGLWRFAMLIGRWLLAGNTADGGVVRV